MERQLFEQMYQGQAPWDIGRPQPSIVDLEASGQIHGSVLDVGCGTGDNALFLASRGHETWGLDFVPAAVERAKAKAAQRALAVHFMVGNALELERALELEQPGKRFDTVIDCGLFHTFGVQERPVFVQGLAAVLQHQGLLHILCFSDQEPGTDGPRRVTQQEIRDAFAIGWQVRQIEPTRFETVEHPGLSFSPGGPKAWLATVQRT
jgi:cyclopropane fatty-acyl-phospholipid synthase-like methyltransferase